MGSNKYSNIFVTLWTRLAPVLCFYNLNSIFDHCYQQNIHKPSVSSIEIKQKQRRNLKIDKNKKPNIFVSKSCYERISEYIHIQKVDTNEYPNKYSDKKYLNIRICSCIRNTLIWTFHKGTNWTKIFTNAGNKFSFASDSTILGNARKKMFFFSDFWLNFVSTQKCIYLDETDFAKTNYVHFSFHLIMQK